MSNQQYQVIPIGVIHSCYKEKFGIPRQPGLVTGAKAQLHLSDPFNEPDYIRGLDGFSHLWLIFNFHHSQGRYKPTVRPPRLGGNKRVGVFASRSTFRPNGMGLSVVKLDGISIQSERIVLELSGVDLVDSTPVFDIKPYIPYSDCVDNVKTGYVDGHPQRSMVIKWQTDAKTQCDSLSQIYDKALQSLIEDTLAYDPRPAYRKGMDDDKVYIVRVYDIDVHWHCSGNNIYVSELKEIL